MTFLGFRTLSKFTSNEGQSIDIAIRWLQSQYIKMNE